SMSSNTRKSLPDDYRLIGEWAGRDDITKVAIYLIDGASVTAQSFNVGTDYKKEVISGQVTLVPQESAAIKTTAGVKKVYVLINGTTEVENALAKTPVAEFENAYAQAALYIANSGTSTTVSTSAEKLAIKNGTTDEKILMTCVEPKTIDVVNNVSAAETTAAASPKNRVSLVVERTVGRVMVSTEGLTYDVPAGNGSTILGTISEIKWVLAQGESSLYLQRKADFATPNFGWVPTTDAQYWGTEITGSSSKYDYSGLFEEYDPTTQFGGTNVATMSDYATNPSSAITDELEASLSGKFILPNTHAYGAGNESGYKKGNTAYVLIRAKFTPSAAAFADGETYTAGDDFFVGANGKFYVSAANAVTPGKGGVTGQTVARYVKGKVLYYAWVNPDNIPTWYNSPVVRNNVYHIHITGFKNLGTNWNPLFPEDPNNPKGEPVDPSNPNGPKKPLNPDPRPNVPGVEEPENPVDPTDPLTTPETWMSVDVTVLPRQLHSYSIDLGI
ncbi:Mfa1 family fimbria major subunit, partial [Dysgonomonas mossii]|uniref:Mfa1 family fimbria major subunit n=2 Tax=Dysgonomonas TaxID=156973 RepID=UPI001ACA0891